MKKSVVILCGILALAGLWATYAIAQQDVPPAAVLPAPPTDLTPENVIFKISTWVMLVLNMSLTYFSELVPILNRINRKYFRAVAVAVAVGVAFVKFGIAQVDNALVAFVFGNVFWEMFFKRKPDVLPNSPEIVGS